MKLILENWRRYLNEGCDTELGKETLPLPPGSKGAWQDQDIACNYADVHAVTSDAKNFILLMDKLAELFNYPEPVVTSGYRNARRQTGPMLNIWKQNNGPEELAAGKRGMDNKGSAYIINLYTDCEKRYACVPGAGELIVKLVNMWEKAANPPGSGPAVSAEAYEKTVEMIEANGGISKHQEGESIDYGFKSNPPEATHIKKMLDYIESHNLANMTPIDETTSKPPHWHITVHSLTKEGVEFLQTPNSVLQGEQENETST